MRIAASLPLALCLLLLLAGMGCSGGSGDAAQAQDSPELEQLRTANQEVQRLRRAAQDLPRLRQEVEEVTRLRQQARDVRGLETENADLQSQIVQVQQQLAQRQAVARGQLSATRQPGVAGFGAGGLGPNAAGTAENPQADGETDPRAIFEGDEILIDPQLLHLIVPGLDTSNIKRTEPIAINSLLESRGLTITNFQQLHELGITNFQVRRLPPKRGDGL